MDILLMVSVCYKLVHCLSFSLSLQVYIAVVG